MRDEDMTKEQLINELAELRQRLNQFTALESECRREAEALRLSEEKSSKAFRSSPDWIVISTLEDGRFIDVNDAFLRITGYRREEVIGRTAKQLGIWAEPDERDKMAAIIREHGKIRDHEARFCMKSGEIRIMLRSAEAIDLEGEKCIISVTHDITERKKAEEKIKIFAEELEKRNRELEQFAYIVSHDLQAPLITAGGYLRLLERRYKEKLDSKAGEFITNAIEGTVRMQSLIRSLLDYARVDTRARDFKLIEASAVLNQALGNLKALLDESGAVVKYDNLPEVRADPVLLSQVFQNLIGNAIKFRGDEPPVIHLSGEKKDKVWLFSVRDNGIGIPPEETGRIFEVFHRSHDKSKYQGTGIGLAICKKIIEHHGGSIRVESAPGKGSTFFFTIRDSSLI
ncbi:MAG TPA: PAS domain S-box protein [Nitrospirae bacterium]|nr:phytochrome-like protein cph1 [bacterium BMS3Abin06]HDH12390.1 PAS domain S-box protein [Nitrospirota bacterium]HDZ01272.1 PAS domain S-box protein [Nitrospirota bacterium]